MENKDVRVCWGTPDTVYYIDGKGETHGIDLSPYGYTFGIWDGVCITSSDRDETYGLMHDDLVEYYIMNNGWPSRGIVSPHDGYGNDYDFEKLKMMPVRYEDDEYGTKDVKQVLYSYDEEYDDYSLRVTWGDGKVEVFNDKDEYQIRNDCYFPENVADDIIYHDGKEIKDGYYLLQYETKNRETYNELIRELYQGGVKLRGRILMDFESNYMNPNSFIAFWNNDEITPENIKILAKTWGSDVYNYILVTETNEQSATRYGIYNMPTLREYLDDKVQIKASSDVSERERLYNIHLGKPEDKRAYFNSFLKNRENIHKNKLGKVTMAQYHNMLYGENVHKKDQVLNEGKRENLPDNKYQHFINEFSSSKNSLLAYFLRETKFDKNDYMPMSKGHINYVRWYRTQDNDTGEYRNIMRNTSKPIVNFYYLNDLIHLFLYSGANNQAEENSTYGHYDYNNGILKYNISYKNPYKKNVDNSYDMRNGHPHRIKGTGDIRVSSLKSPKGVYSPMTGDHKKVYKFGDRFNQYFNPEAAIFNANGDMTGTIHIKGNDQIQHYLFPVADPNNDDKLEQDVMALISSIYSNFNGSSEESQKSYALFLAFLVGEYNHKIHGFDIWKKYAPRAVNAWRSIIVSDAEKIIDEFEREYQEKLNSAPRKNAITYSPHELRDPEPINSTPLQAKNVRAWLNQMDGKDIDESRIKREIFISESQ